MKVILTPVSYTHLNGSVIELTTKHIECETTVPAGEVFVDGGGVGEVGAVVLNDRKLLAEDGMIFLICSIKVNGKPFWL